MGPNMPNEETFTSDAIRKIIRSGAANLLDAITQEIYLLDAAPLDRHAANRLEIYAEQLSCAAREIYDLQREADQHRNPSLPS